LRTYIRQQTLESLFNSGLHHPIVLKYGTKDSKITGYATYVQENMRSLNETGRKTIVFCYQV